MTAALPFTLTTRPWWISHAIYTQRGVVVARAEGISSVLREPTADDLASGIAANQYDHSAEFHGNYCRLMIELTEDNQPGASHETNSQDIQADTGPDQRGQVGVRRHGDHANHPPDCRGLPARHPGRTLVALRGAQRRR